MESRKIALERKIFRGVPVIVAQSRQTGSCLRKLLNLLNQTTPIRNKVHVALFIAGWWLLGNFLFRQKSDPFYQWPFSHPVALQACIHNYYKKIHLCCLQSPSLFLKYNSVIIIKETEERCKCLSDFYSSTIQPAIDCGMRDTCSFRIHFHFQEEEKKTAPQGNITPAHEYAGAWYQQCHY